MSTSGVCAIKPEFIIQEPAHPVIVSNLANSIERESNDSQNSSEGNPENKQPPEKKLKLSKSEKKKNRGQNKSRPAPFKVNFKTELCKHLVDVAENEALPQCNNPKCPFIHNITEYLQSKPKDLGPQCVNFLLRGRCPRGITCRFGSTHISPDGRNMIDQEKFEKFRPSTVNILNNDLQVSLRKKVYNFQRAIDAVAQNDLRKLQIENSANLEKSVGLASDEDLIKLRKSEKKTIDWAGKLYLSPLTTVGNLPFRRICKEYGADITCGEMAMGVSLLQAANQEWALVKKHESEDIFGVQLCGNNPYIISKCAQALEDNMDVSFIELNLGCPIDLVYKQGAGSGLLRRERILESIVRCTSNLLSIPLTMKTRTGVYSDQNIAHKLVPKFRDWGASMTTIHGRSKEQRYTRVADWDYINKCAELANPMPVFGNGDILSYEDYKHARDTYKNVSGVMIGRGALIKPWIFTEIKEQRLWDIRSSERFDILKKYVNYGLEHWGSDNKGVENTRRFLLEWLSFLHRYIPVGVLECPPQKINQRPPYYKGRDELETLMASANCSDWIKITTMLLGPVPDNFHFIPKHKANAY